MLITYGFRILTKIIVWLRCSEGPPQPADCFTILYEVNAWLPLEYTQVNDHYISPGMWPTRALAWGANITPKIRSVIKHPPRVTLRACSGASRCSGAAQNVYCIIVWETITYNKTFSFRWIDLMPFWYFFSTRMRPCVYTQLQSFYILQLQTAVCLQLFEDVEDVETLQLCVHTCPHPRTEEVSKRHYSPKAKGFVVREFFSVNDIVYMYYIYRSPSTFTC